MATVISYTAELNERLQNWQGTPEQLARLMAEAANEYLLSAINGGKCNPDFSKAQAGFIISAIRFREDPKIQKMVRQAANVR